VARRAGTLDTSLQQLRQELGEELDAHCHVNDSRDVDRRHAPRAVCQRDATIRIGVLQVRGNLTNMSAGGAFLRVDVLVEVGEQGSITVGERSAEVRVAWLRGAGHPEGPGMGLTFTMGDRREEIEAVELALAVLR
jgi:hypothetical protein